MCAAGIIASLQVGASNQVQEVEQDLEKLTAHKKRMVVLIEAASSGAILISYQMNIQGGRATTRAPELEAVVASQGINDTSSRSLCPAMLGQGRDGWGSRLSWWHAATCP
jgi:hypothetical protein